LAGKSETNNELKYKKECKLHSIKTYKILLYTKNIKYLLRIEEIWD